MSYPRIIVGAALSVVGLVLVSQGHEMSGILVLLAGITIGVRGSLTPIVGICFGLIQFLLFVFWMWWMNQSQYDYVAGFDYWVQDYWLLIVYVAGMSFVPVFATFFENESNWTVMVENYSRMPDCERDIESYPFVSGLLRVDEEAWNISVAATESGVVIDRFSGGHVFFSWERIEEIRVVDGKANTVQLKIKRSTPLPLHIQLPWNAEFARFMPSRLNVAGA